MKEIKKIIILGNTSFIGKYLINLLKIEYPKIKIIGLNSKNTDLTLLDSVYKLKENIDKHTMIIMLSANLKQNGANINDFMQNIRMAENLCQLFDICPPKRFVYFSSNAVYGEYTENILITEETKVNPTSYYGIAKFTSENIFLKTFEKYDNNSLLILRMPRIYGAGAKNTSRGPTMFTYNAFFQKEISIWGDGLELRSYVFINDLTDIVAKLIFLSFEGVINIASNDSYSFIDVLEIVKQVCNKELIITHKARTKPKVNHSFHNNKLISIIGDYKFTSLNAGIQSMLEYIQLNNNYISER